LCGFPQILADRRIAELSTDIAVMQGEKRYASQRADFPDMF
jgi:hypothetical protein